MDRSKGGGRRPRLLLLLAVIQMFAPAHAGPIGYPNSTLSEASTDGACALGDVVYAVGEEVPGADPCERCRCASAGVSCERTTCAARPGCKALHRPDHCCPTYQCECEQEGRVYGNGEKLVDPQDPCRVCYCQGGEVVCRRIACFLRDDCTPRRVPGRCCPEYDNCPLRGVTALPGMTATISTGSHLSSPAPPPHKENVKQEITIKEITPVSEIPILPEIKIKEILPSPSIEVTEYSSSKSPLIVREATTEKSDKLIFTEEDDAPVNDNTPTVVEVQSSAAPQSTSSLTPEPAKEADNSVELKSANDSPPSKISLSTQDSINSDIYPSLHTIVPMMGVPPVTLNNLNNPTSVTTKAPVMEEEDPALFEHNPAFPPLPDDLSVLRNHEDEILPEQIPEEHVSEPLDVENTPSASPSTSEASPDTPAQTTKAIITEKPTTTTTSAPTTTFRAIETSTTTPNVVTESSTKKYVTTGNNDDDAKELTTAEPTSTLFDTTIGSQTPAGKDSPMLNLRSAIPSEILNIPSLIPEETIEDVTTSAEIIATEPSSTETDKIVKVATIEANTATKTIPVTTSLEPKIESESQTVVDETTPSPSALQTSSQVIQTTQEVATSSNTKSNEATDFTAQTELSSLPVETSDQNPQETSENSPKESESSTENPAPTEIVPAKDSVPVESEIITVSNLAPSSDNKKIENIETTEFIVTSLGSSESATDNVELIKIAAEPEKLPSEPEKSAAIIDEPAHGKKNNVLTDLINLVGDVASIGDHTDIPESPRPTTSAPQGISESEELIPVNAGYKSKNSNWNVNSITETVGVKNKGQTGSKQRVVEIEGEEGEAIFDAAPPHDRVEPTTHRPVIDHVGDSPSAPANRTDNKEIEIITRSYVPTINRKPTKVVMKKSNEKPLSEETATEDALDDGSAETSTDVTATTSSEGRSTSAEVLTTSDEKQSTVPDSLTSLESHSTSADSSAEMSAEPGSTPVTTTGFTPGSAPGSTTGFTPDATPGSTPASAN